ncbi:MAG: 2-hydroxyacyl-CoA dehydratase family protein [Lachnospiraceae bacterium]|jgi:benzoyl-CoA reductase/2-hydroxyglutaryl-CoA dehydratase subunit BcrC/BadD/HgdB|nr:2-hydroxyacyl-CoA dehydratase family protein [Lachnospiraceae bacterium]
MNIAKTYGSWVKSCMEKDPEKAGSRIRRGLHLESFRVRHFSDKRMPKAYRYLNYMAIRLVADALDKPDTLAYINIFAPVEILECFGLTCVSMEALASYLSGFYMEDVLIDRAEALGIAPTLCTYHKNFIGAMDSGILPKPEIGVTTTMVCDGNVNTFRYLQDRFDVPCCVLDIPHSYSPEAEQYVVRQLRELIAALEKKTGRTLDMEELKERLRRENRSKEYYMDFLRKRAVRSYPNTLTLMLFQLFASHLDIGMDWVEKCFRMMDEEIDTYPVSDELRLFWIHVEPYPEPTLRAYLNYGEEVTIAGGDFDLDYTEPLDAEHPLEALARKMICNIYNGDFSRKADAIEKMVQTCKPDGVVEYCHWGCRQSAGGAGLIRERMKKLNVPMLVLDGDAIDRRNTQDGQIRTRFEAFLEVLRQQRKDAE